MSRIAGFLSGPEFADAFLQDPEKWFEAARTLWISAAELEKLHLAGDAETRTLRDDYSEVEKNSPEWASSYSDAMDKFNCARVASMLRAMAVEALLKGTWYAKETREKGHVTSVAKSKHSHNLWKIAKDIGLPFDEDHNRCLNRMKEMIEMGRYPVSMRGGTSWESDPELDARVYEAIRVYHAGLAQ